MSQVFFRELNGFLNSLIGYLVIGVFLVAMGLLMWVFTETSVLDYGYADMDTLFSVGPYVFIFLVPAITMRTFSEEKKLGTLELLLTKPLAETDIVAGKFFASFCLVIISLAPTVIYYFTLSTLGNPPGNIDTPGVTGSFIGMILLGSVFCAVGIFASSITPNQVVSFIVAAFLSFVLYSGLDSIAAISPNGETALFIRQLGMLYHFESLGKGLIDSRDVIYFLSLGGVMLLLTKTIISSRSW
ncbi:MAG TPA: gliding motility-associated ABC transporter permease subunit GldF [Cyclobacteriaceae bacterium]|nr:gliding motility-associated ABC transporter permease subunit GldF [Cyclobacteriaceae bacterium]